MFKRKQAGLPEASRANLLASRPVAAPGIKVERLDNGVLRLAVPVPKRRLARWLTRSDAPVIRRFELDAMGAEVWAMMDGQHSVRQMIESFAEKHKLNLREAEVAMLAYLRTLAGRGIMMLAVPEEATDESGD